MRIAIFALSVSFLSASEIPQGSHALLRLVPVLHHHILQLVVQELFRRPLPRRIHFDEIRPGFEGCPIGRHRVFGMVEVLAPMRNYHYLPRLAPQEAGESQE